MLVGRQALEVRPEADGLEVRAGLVGLDGPGLQPAAHLVKAGGAQALLGRSGACEVPRHRPVREALGEAGVRGGPQRRLVDGGDVALPPALRADPAARPQRRRERCEQRVVVGHPVKRRVGEHGVDALVQPQRREIGSANVGGRVLELDPARATISRVGVDGDDAAVREAIEQQARHPARAAARVEDRLVAAQLEAVDDGLGHRDLRAGDPVVGVGVPATDRAHKRGRDRPGPLALGLVRRDRVVLGERQRDVVEAVEQAVLGLGVDVERGAAAVPRDLLRLEVDGRAGRRP